MNHTKVTLKPRRDISVLRRHPWVFSGGINQVEGDPQSGDLVGVYDNHDTFLAWGHYSSHSQIRVRLFSWREDEPSINTPEFWRLRLARAIQSREHLLALPDTNAYRLVYSESDGIPGLICDLYDRTAVVQFLSAGANALRDTFIEVIWEQLDVDSLYERSDSDVMHKEGLKSQTGLLAGRDITEPINILENGLRFQVDVRQGHKTGFYIDQKENRNHLGQIVADLSRVRKNVNVLNVFSYTGAFSIYALANGATQVTNVDSSASALAVALRNTELNGYDSVNVQDIEGDAFKVLRALRKQEQSYDAIVLDPPKFAFTQKDVKRASRGYKDINMQAMHLLRPGGHLLTFSCSGAISADLFQKIVFGAALDVRRNMQITGYLSQGADHPVLLTFPEAAYLKGLMVKAVD